MERWRPILWVIVIGAAVSVAIALAFRKGEGTASLPASTPTSTPAAGMRDDSFDNAEELEKPSLPVRSGAIARPRDAKVELGVMTEMTEKDLAKLLELPAAAALLESRHCGDAPTCDAVRAFIRGGGGGGVTLTVLPPMTWILPNEIEKATSDLVSGERDSLKRRRVIVVHTAGEALPKQLPARAGFALAGALAEKTNGLVYDQLSDRIERAASFVARAITAPIGASVYRADRIDVQFMARDHGLVRLLTTGLARFGSPDVDVHEAYDRDAPALAEILYAASEALVNGKDVSPLMLSRNDLERARGEGSDAGAGPDDDPGMASAPIAVGIDSVVPEDGDPNMVMARILPADGITAGAYGDLAAAFFGEGAPPPPEQSPEEMERLAKERVDRELPTLLDRTKKEGAKLYLQFPFVVPPEQGTMGTPAEPEEEWLWIEVRSFDAKSVTGVLMDSSETVPDADKGQTVTRARADALDYQLEVADGAIEDPH